MTLADPRPFPPFLLGPMRFQLALSNLTARDGLGGISGGRLGTDLWTWGGDFIGLTDAGAKAIESWVDSLDGSANSFQAQDVRAWYPKAHPLLTGITATASSFSVDTTRRLLTLNGLTNGTTLTPGDLVGFKGGTGLKNRHSVRVVDGGVVAGGTVTVEVRPAVWATVEGWAGCVAHLDKPSVTMRLVDAQVSDTGPEGYMTARISAMQVVPET